MSESHTADLATRARYRQEGADYEQERIIKLIKSKEWVGQTLAEDVDNLVRLIKGKK